MNGFGSIETTQDMTVPYNPLDYQNLAQSVVRALLERADSELPPTEPFSGSGVYALYYTGPLPFYAFLASEELKTPIYVGKAVPSGSRKGSATDVPETNSALYRRLGEHAKSIQQAENLRMDEFRCRFLVVEPVWITLAERFLINHFKPIWNTVIDGFGNHDPGRGRRAMRRPRWDVVHPGRPWASALNAEETEDEIIASLPSTN